MAGGRAIPARPPADALLAIALPPPASLTRAKSGGMTVLAVFAEKLAAA
jgi:hypothetical protein